MSARLDPDCDFYGMALINSIEWLEATTPEVVVLNIDYKAGHVALWGEPDDTEKFRHKLGSMLDQVIDPRETEHWRI